MNAAFVVDCSLAMTWLFRDEATLQSAELLERLATETALVPDLWYLEVTNVIALAERKGRITAAQSAEFIVEVSKLDIEIDRESSDRAFDDLLRICRTHQLTSYDAAYLELALRRSVPLATLDEPLRKAAERLGIQLLGK